MRRPILLVWACFLARGLFYTSMLPVWEGYDEWAHFSVVRAMLMNRQPLVARDQPIPRDVDASLKIIPVPWEQRKVLRDAVSQEAYWNLPPAERRTRERLVRDLPHDWAMQPSTGGIIAYEALQGPLYYWIMAPALWIMRGAAMLTQVMVLRWLSVLIASLAIPLIYFLALEILDDRIAALGCAAVAALMPGLLNDVGRVGNDCLAVALFTALSWVVVRGKLNVKGPVLLGLGLITKAYFLTVVPVVFARMRRRIWFAAAIVLAIAAWWYVRNEITTGTFSGLSESVTLRRLGFLGTLRHAADVPWRTAVDAILLSHLYFGGWSSLTVRSWMYHVLYAVAFAGAVGLLLQLRRRGIPWLLAIYLMFWLGQLYNVILLYLSKGLPGSMGWYMYAVVGAEVVLCTAGFGRFARWGAALGAFLFGALDLYSTNAIAIPYYTGMIAHKASGAIAAIHASEFRAVGFSGAFERLAVNKGPLVSPSFLIVLWAIYLAATITLMFGVAAAARMWRADRAPTASGRRK